MQKRILFDYLEVDGEVLHHRWSMKYHLARPQSKRSFSSTISMILDKYESIKDRQSIEQKTDNLNESMNQICQSIYHCDRPWSIWCMITEDINEWQESFVQFSLDHYDVRLDHQTVLGHPNGSELSEPHFCATIFAHTNYSCELLWKIGIVWKWTIQTKSRLQFHMIISKEK